MYVMCVYTHSLADLFCTLYTLPTAPVSTWYHRRQARPLFYFLFHRFLIGELPRTQKKGSFVIQIVHVYLLLFMCKVFLYVHPYFYSRNLCAIFTKPLFHIPNFRPQFSSLLRRCIVVVVRHVQGCGFQVIGVLLPF